ncbi:DUF5677 domain-containing protein [Psychrobacillus vulpis]|uniref:Uncharacterized protein n=1 Tax=Psychrobacillus vulpis TaxID=2325572 RepID=A0A544TR62_9BACI|nr:DUF5677 domain-containing protein [Psychrobacillus vulpis]TQR19925.1 hypothetical protein FG384_09685 [Psychrobacillus vulpis]
MNLTFEQLFNKAVENISEQYEREGKKLSEDILLQAIENSLDEDLFDNIAEGFYQILKDNMYEPLESERLLHCEFRSRIKQRWLKPLALFNGFIIITEEICANDINKSKEIKILDENTSEHTLKYYTIMKLLAKQIILAKEIIYLLEGGFADAALSRWRTAHESKIILLLFLKCSDDERILKELLTRFNDASIIEEYKELRNYGKTTPENTYYNDLKINYHKVLKKYGDKFRWDYEWARPIFSNLKRRIYFKDLENHIRVHEETTSFYQKANYQIHSSPLGTFASLGTIDMEGMESPAYIFGPSNLGLRIPGQLEIFTLYETIVTYLNTDPSIDNLIYIKTLGKFMNEIFEEFEKVEEEIINDELSLREER